MKPELVKKLKSPLKVNIEITGPTIGICDVPIKRNPNTSLKLFPIKQAEKIIEEAINQEILMFSFILSDPRDLLQPSVSDYLNLICKRINRYGGLTALHLPVNLPSRKSALKDFSDCIAQKVVELQIDILLIFIPNSVLKDNGKEIGKIMLTLALKDVQLVRVYTNFPFSIKEIEGAVIPGLKRVAEIASIWRTFNLVFTIDKKSRFYPQIIKFLENGEDIGDFTFSFLPTIPYCIAKKFDLGANLDIYTGVCPAAHISSTIDIYGHLIPCSYLRKYKLPQIDLLWRNWAKVQNSWLLKTEACRQCEYENRCEGLCNLWKNQAI